MLSTKEVCEKSEMSIHTFQSWRRHGSRLLPDPIGVVKRVIYFDSSILERIKFIKSQQAAGKSLEQIEAELVAAREFEREERKEWHPSARAAVREAITAEKEIVAEEFRATWQNGDCVEEVCRALGLDQAITGRPLVSLVDNDEDEGKTFKAYVTIIANRVVHFAELLIGLHGDPVVNQRENIDVINYGMLLNVISQVFIERQVVIETAKIPLLLFKGDESIDLTAEEWRGKIGLAISCNKLMEFGYEAVGIYKEKYQD